MNGRSALQRLRHDDPGELLRRAVRKAYFRLGAAELDFPLLPQDVADSTRLGAPAPLAVHACGPLSIGWVCTPPSAGSGGHTTLFRMVAAAEAAGHRCTVLLYDRHGGDPAGQAAVIRSSWPWVHAAIRTVDDGFAGIDVAVASSWQTAHVLAARGPDDLRKAYFIQDYEPFFYPRGPTYELAADSYRFGFVNIALGGMVHDRLREELDVDSALVPFSCDTTVYRHEHTGPRNGVVLYAKPDVPRRGYRLAALALAEFHRRHPEQHIHVYGEPVPDLAVPATHHGRLCPADLNNLYNRALAGLAMSFTNISLVAEEMLAAGCVPVVNDSRDARADLTSPYVAWAPPTPGGLADALCWTVEAPPPTTAVAASVRADDWHDSGAAVVRILEGSVRGAPGPISAGSGR